MDAKKLITVGVALLLLFFVITQPHTAAGIVTNILDVLKSGAESVITFIGALFNG